MYFIWDIYIYPKWDIITNLGDWFQVFELVQGWYPCPKHI